MLHQNYQSEILILKLHSVTLHCISTEIKPLPMVFSDQRKSSFCPQQDTRPDHHRHRPGRGVFRHSHGNQEQEQTPESYHGKRQRSRDQTRRHSSHRCSQKEGKNSRE